MLRAQVPLLALLCVVLPMDEHPLALYSLPSLPSSFLPAVSLGFLRLLLEQLTPGPGPFSVSSFKAIVRVLARIFLRRGKDAHGRYGTKRGGRGQGEDEEERNA